MYYRAVGDQGQSEFEDSLRKLFQALVLLMADAKKETLLTQVSLCSLSFACKLGVIRNHDDNGIVTVRKQ